MAQARCHTAACLNGVIVRIADDRQREQRAALRPFLAVQLVTRSHRLPDIEQLGRITPSAEARARPRGPARTQALLR